MFKTGREKERYPDPRRLGVPTKPQPKPAVRKRVAAMTPSIPEETLSGVVLVNMALQPIALDLGAVHILQQQDEQASNLRQRLPMIPEEILSAMSSRRPGDQSCRSFVFPIGKRRYRCRFYTIQSDNPALSPGVLAVHFDADSEDDPIRQIVNNYHLTEREEEALGGIALGLSTKEVADRMKISPNTVKSFVRLIMIKLGVDSRAAIMVKLLESSECTRGSMRVPLQCL